MDTGEIIAILIVVGVLLVGALIIGLRCCRSCTSIIHEAGERNKFAQSIREGLRRSARRLSFRRSGSSMRRRQSPSGKPVTVVATIEDLQRERSELHPIYMSTSERNVVEREDGDGASTTAGTASASVAAGTVQFTAKLAEERDLIKPRVEEERLRTSDACVNVEDMTRDSTDTDLDAAVLSTDPISSSSVDLLMVSGESDSDGFSNPCFRQESPVLREVKVKVTSDGPAESSEVAVDESGGIENPGYLIMGTPQTERSQNTKHVDHEIMQKFCEQSSENPSQHLNTMEEDFRAIQIKQKCLIEFDPRAETDVDEPLAIVPGTAAQDTGVILEVPKSFVRAAPNRASFGALKVRPGKLTEKNIQGAKEVVDESDAKGGVDIEERYYRAPAKGEMYPDRCTGAEDAVAKHVEAPELPPTMTQQTQYVHACYEVTGSGVMFSDDDRDLLISDSFI